MNEVNILQLYWIQQDVNYRFHKLRALNLNILLLNNQAQHFKLL